MIIKKVYSKYMYLSFLVISIFCYILAIISLIFIPVEYTLSKIIITALLLSVGTPLLWYVGFLNQNLVISGNELILKNKYKSMIIMNINDIARIEIQKLPTYSSWVTTIYKDHICIYSYKDNINFTSSAQNRSGNQRIQLFYSKEKYEFLKNLVDHVSISSD